jgi:hypothetical protein
VSGRRPRFTAVLALGALLVVSAAHADGESDDDKKQKKKSQADVEDVVNAAAGAASVGANLAAAQAGEAAHARRSTYFVASAGLTLAFPLTKHEEFNFSPGIAADGLAGLGDHLRVGGTLGFGLFGLDPDAYGERFRPTSGESTEAMNFRIGPRVELNLTRGPVVPFVSLGGTFTVYNVRLSKECVDDTTTTVDECAGEDAESKDSLSYTAFSLAPGAGIAIDVGSRLASQRLFLRADYVINSWLSGPRSEGLRVNHLVVTAGMSFGFI